MLSHLKSWPTSVFPTFHEDKYFGKDAQVRRKCIFDMDFLKKAFKSGAKATETLIKQKSIQPLLCPVDEDFSPTSGCAFLHGYLLINIYAAKDLPDMESW